MKNRIEFIDIAKVIGIYLVVLGHYVYHLQLPFKEGALWSIEHSITLFHMPLFFLISGILYKEIGLIECWKKCRIQLLNPYLYICTICLIIGGLLNITEFLNNPKLILHNILGFISGADFFGKGFITYSAALWFCYSLCIIKLLTSIIDRAKCNNRIKMLIIFMGGGCLMYIGECLPLRIDSSIVGLIFFYAGYIYKYSIKKISEYNKSKLLIIAISMLALLILFACLNIDYSQRQCLSINAMTYGKHPLLFILSGFAGSFFVFAISQLCLKFYNRTFITI